MQRPRSAAELARGDLDFYLTPVPRGQGAAGAADRARRCAGWRAARPRERKQVSFLTGDAGQFLFEHGRVTAVLDLELACLGDPLADLGALRCARSLRAARRSLRARCATTRPRLRGERADAHRDRLPHRALRALHAAGGGEPDRASARLARPGAVQRLVPRLRPRGAGGDRALRGHRRWSRRRCRRRRPRWRPRARRTSTATRATPRRASQPGARAARSTAPRSRPTRSPTSRRCSARRRRASRPRTPRSRRWCCSAPIPRARPRSCARCTAAACARRRCSSRCCASSRAWRFSGSRSKPRVSRGARSRTGPPACDDSRHRGAARVLARARGPASQRTWRSGVRSSS